jgi:hypothetical protein
MGLFFKTQPTMWLISCRRSPLAQMLQTLNSRGFVLDPVLRQQKIRRLFGVLALCRLCAITVMFFF